ncbi:MAG: hypothetical protein ACLP7P_20085 [Rhodomicrobium sp.]
MSEILAAIHVRFAPDGTVTAIGEQPPGLSAQEWFNRLSLNTQNAYCSLAGGRGVFRIARAEVEALKASGLN